MVMRRMQIGSQMGASSSVVTQTQAQRVNQTPQDPNIYTSIRQ